MFVSLEEIAEEQRDLEARMAAWLKKVAAYDRSGDWAADGFLNTASALRAVCRIDQGVARGHVELARKLEDLPQVAAAFERGEISQRHAVVVANAYTPERAGAISDGETQLVDFALQHLPKQLSGVVRYLIDAIDGDGAVSDDALFERRRHHMSTTLDGMVTYDGICDPETGAIRNAAINAEMDRDRVDHDPRTPAQRRFDALTNLLRRSLDRGELGGPATSAPTSPSSSISTSCPGTHLSSPPACVRRAVTTVTFRPRHSNDSPATATSAGSSPPAAPKSSTSAAPRAPSHPQSGKRSSYATNTAKPPDATDHPTPAKPITSCTGPAADPPTSRISNSCVGTTTATDTPTTPKPAPRKRLGLLAAAVGSWPA